MDNTIYYDRRDFENDVWNINEPDAQPAPVVPSGVTTSGSVSRCSDLTISRITESGNIGCAFTAGGTCLAESDYTCVTYNDKNGIGYKWKIISGNVAFISNGTGGMLDDEETITIRSTSGQDEPFTLECTVTDGLGNSTSKQASFVHARTVAP